MSRTSPLRKPELIFHHGAAMLHLTLGIGDYDHTRDVVHGVIRPEGIVLTAVVLPPEEVFFRFINNLEWDVAEMSSAKYIAMTAAGNSPMVAIPVFPSRVFRHAAIYVRADRKIAKAKDLEGRTVGVPEWTQTAGIYARGILAEEYGVDLKSIRWVQAGVDEPSRVEKNEIHLKGLTYERRADTSLSAMLLSGELDAAISARTPSAFAAGEGKVVRLFPDFRQEEQRFYERTRVFPIMHMIAMRRPVFEAYPWAATSLYKAFDAAKRRCLERLGNMAASANPMPWTAATLEGLAAAFGSDPWPYGVDPNRTTLTAFCRYAHDQGVTQRRVSPDELFPPELRAGVKA